MKTVIRGSCFRDDLINLVEMDFSPRIVFVQVLESIVLGRVEAVKLLPPNLHQPCSRIATSGVSPEDHAYPDW